MDTIIKNGTIVTAYEKYKADIGILNGKIVQIGENLNGNENTEKIDASEKLILPGMIDAHVHLQLPFSGTVSADNFE
ncbi:MAG: dihydropyrimidinase, partial [Candidatus Hodarchaeales archaeon]